MYVRTNNKMTDPTAPVMIPAKAIPSPPYSAGFCIAFFHAINPSTRAIGLINPAHPIMPTTPITKENIAIV